MSGERVTTLLLTERAINDLRAIESFSVERWGETVADRYLDDIEASLSRCSQNPGLLVSRSELSPRLKFYVVNKHLLVCDVTDECIVVLTIAHSSPDLLTRLEDLEPTLKAEVQLLQDSARKAGH